MAVLKRMNRLLDKHRLVLIVPVTAALLGFVHYAYYDIRLLLDAGLQLFTIANSTSPAVTSHRYSQLLAQVFPVIGAKTGLPLAWLAVLYEINEFVLLFLPVMAAWLAKRTGLLFAALLAILLTPGKDFLLMSMEITYTAPLIIMWMLSFEIFRQRSKLLMLGICSLISFFLIYSHPLAFVSFLPSVCFYLIWNGYLKKFLFSAAGITSVLIMAIILALRVLKLDEYDVGRLHEAEYGFPDIHSMLNAYAVIFRPGLIWYILPMAVISVCQLLWRNKKEGAAFLSSAILLYPYLLMAVAGRTKFDSMLMYEPHKYLLPLLLLLIFSISLLLGDRWKHGSNPVKIIITALLINYLLRPYSIRNQ
jgi:hypothetical protein